jgi:hypothetical protein
MGPLNTFQLQEGQARYRSGMAQRSATFERFLWGLHDSGPWSRDAIDTMLANVAELPNLIGDERVEAEELAIANVRSGDCRAALALADVGCTRAIPALAELGRSPGCHDLLRVGTALLRLGDDTGLGFAVTVLRDEHQQPFTRCEAAEPLSRHPFPGADAALRPSTVDPNPEVRAAATRALRRLTPRP